MRYRLEYALLWPIVKVLGLLSPSLARLVAAALAFLFYLGAPRLRRVARRNLELAMPGLSAAERRRIARGVFRSFSRMLAEFARFPRYGRDDLGRIIFCDGLENYEAAVARGRGVLFLTGHLGAWELGAFAQSLYGRPLHVVMRALDNPFLNHLVNRYRALGGNRIIEKRDFLRGILEALRNNEAVGILMDQNSSPDEGVFVDFFGVPACASAGLAKIALRTGAAVVPAFALWEKDLGKYRLRFDPPLELVSTGDADQDVAANTQLFTKVLEDRIRRHPDQWLWIHRRWKTRPPGGKAIYD